MIMAMFLFSLNESFYWVLISPSLLQDTWFSLSPEAPFGNSHITYHLINRVLNIHFYWWHKNRRHRFFCTNLSISDLSLYRCVPSGHFKDLLDFWVWLEFILNGSLLKMAFIKISPSPTKSTSLMQKHPCIIYVCEKVFNVFLYPEWTVLFLYLLQDD